MASMAMRGLEGRQWKTKEVGNLPGARSAMEKREIDLFLWEKFTTNYLVEQDEWQRVGTLTSPWPAFVFAISKEAMTHRKEEVMHAISVTKQECDSFKLNLEDQSVQRVAEDYHMDVSKAETWLDATEWECSTNVDTDSIKKAMSYLNFIGQINVTS